ncbi:hypothetical protein [Subtercola sp. YIM 133946]|uniref:hypothetical protein n=1 Tax=Subtercola sp. YIM 133946 TaxID=3118909 RepID=UPI002F94FB45
MRDSFEVRGRHDRARSGAGRGRHNRAGSGAGRGRRDRTPTGAAEAPAAATREPGWRARYVDDVGFTLISLFDAFTVVGAIDMGAPVPVAIGVGAVGVVAGILVVNRAKARLALRV